MDKLGVVFSSLVFLLLINGMGAGTVEGFDMQTVNPLDSNSCQSLLDIGLDEDDDWTDAIVNVALIPVNAIGCIVGVIWTPISIIIGVSFTHPLLAVINSVMIIMNALVFVMIIRGN